MIFSTGFLPGAPGPTPAMFSIIRGFHDPLPLPRSGLPSGRRGVGPGLPLRARSAILPAMMRASPLEGGAWAFSAGMHVRRQNRIDAVRLMCQSGVWDPRRTLSQMGLRFRAVGWLEKTGPSADRNNMVFSARAKDGEDSLAGTAGTLERLL